ncbi:MAG: SAM-dependent methyltransferase [Pseudomonadota bacterium]
MSPPPNGEAEKARATCLAASFRDPCGFVFLKEGRVYRWIHASYADNYHHLTTSGLYGELVKRQLLIPHEEVESAAPESPDHFSTILPEQVPFISYPYEWCFGQLKAAAAATLEIQNTCLEYGMSLKDAGAYNIQFKRGKPVLIDSLSFDRYVEGRPWAAYRQFCQHFLAPLALMSYKDVRVNLLSKSFIDGCPLDLASTLLPLRTWSRPSLLFHIHLHARSQRYFSAGVERYRQGQIGEVTSGRRMSRRAVLGLVDQLLASVRRLKWTPPGTEWADYYNETNYSDRAFEQKQEIVRRLLEGSGRGMVWDFGANTGVFSRIAAGMGNDTVAFDLDPVAVERNYRECLGTDETRVLPLIMDLSNPTPGVGWENRERMSLAERGPADTVLALALVHHLAISNNVPFHRIAAFFSRLCRRLIIEFVPKNDSQVQRLLSAREDVFPGYTRDDFEKEFSGHFSIEQTVPVSESGRVIYSMTAKQDPST